MELTSLYLYQRTIADGPFSKENFQGTMYEAVDTILREEDIRPSENLRREYLQTLCRGAAFFSGPWIFTFGRLHPGLTARLMQRSSEIKTNSLFVAAACLGKTALIARLLLEGDALVSKPNPYLGSALRCAAMQGHYDTTRTLLDAGADVNCLRLLYKDFALAAAAFEGHRHIVELLLEPRYNCTTFGKYYETAICRAARGGHLEIVLFMIQRGKFNNLKDLTQTILGEAAGYGQENVVQWALDNGAEVHDSTQRLSNKSALNHAALNEQEDVVQWALDNGAEAHSNIQRLSNKSALNHAALNGQESVVRLLLRRAPYNFRDAFLQTMVGGSERTARTIFNAMMQPTPYRRGWSPTLQGPFGETCLIWAAKHGQTHMIHFLMEKGAGVTQTGGEMAMYYAARKGHISTVRALVAYGAALNSSNSARDPLDQARAAGHHDLVKLLIELGVR
ncbi:ankyrin [Cenococcum geophilum 1.58]|uniref:ankyrin n=1 Tax=Cenococcum geophilum 1.58 TaxID=794803 RepID=UPI00358FB27B|nr:ankyrin [Cenococcum geophilum 1.58]